MRGIVFGSCPLGGLGFGAGTGRGGRGLGFPSVVSGSCIGLFVLGFSVFLGRPSGPGGGRGD